MKTWITIFLFSFIACMTGLSQSNTYEITPIFQSRNLEYISEVVDVDGSFEDLSFVGFSGFHFDAEHKDVKYRVMYREGWSPWLDFSPQHEMGARTRTAYEGAFIRSSFSALQFKMSDELDTPLTIRLFMGHRKTSAKPIRQRSSSCDQPDICDRSCWCATCPIDVSPQLTEPSHIIVHHSAGSNDTTLNFSEVVNYIWDLHVNTNGWDDIGYNWLIDPDGVVYEGRPDGYQGAHFSCINENTIGICLLGDFTSVLPTEKATTSLVDLIGYEATEHEIDVLGESYHVTGDFNLTNIAGHRDSSGSNNACSGTACPGDQFYPMLDSIRAAVADLDCYENNVSGLETLDKSSWSIFPNPFQDVLTVYNADLDDVKLEIVDITGRTRSGLLSNQFQDLSHLASGLYFIMNEGRIVGKVVKE